jgi:hypothetical protein
MGSQNSRLLVRRLFRAILNVGEVGVGPIVLLGLCSSSVATAAVVLIVVKVLIQNVIEVLYSPEANACRNSQQPNTKEVVGFNTEVVCTRHRKRHSEYPDEHVDKMLEAKQLVPFFVLLNLLIQFRQHSVVYD